MLEGIAVVVLESGDREALLERVALIRHIEVRVKIM